MNFYALNVAPIDGWQTQFAAGDAALMLSELGDGTDATLGSASAEVSLSAQADPAVSMEATAQAAMTLVITGDAVIGAQPVVAHPGYGDMEMTMKGIAYPVTLRSENGLGQLFLVGRYDIPDPVIIPLAFMGANKSNVMSALSREKALIVQRDPPAAPVQPTGRMQVDPPRNP